MSAILVIALFFLFRQEPIRCGSTIGACPLIQRLYVFAAAALSLDGDDLGHLVTYLDEEGKP